MLVIDLQKFLTEGSKILSGRPRGKDVRDDVGLDALDKTDEEIVIHIPEDIYSVNSSFFLGMFTKSIEDLGEEGFLKKYKFTGYDIQERIREGLRVTLTTTSPLAYRS